MLMQGILILSAQNDERVLRRSLPKVLALIDRDLYIKVLRRSLPKVLALIDRDLYINLYFHLYSRVLRRSLPKSSKKISAQGSSADRYRSLHKFIFPFIFQSSKKISAQGSSADRYRLLLSDGQLSYSHAMLATQLNSLMETGEMDNLSIIQVDKYLCNTIQGDRRVMILLDVAVLSRGEDVGQRIGNPQQYKSTGEQPSHSSSNASNSSYSVKPSTPSTPGSTRVHTIMSLTPYQNRWRIRARVTQKSTIRTWSNSRGEGRLFNVNLVDESGEIRATGFNEAIDKFYELLEIYYFSKCTLKTANKQYSSVNNDYEMTFNADTIIEPCNEDVSLPSMTFDFTKINELDKKQPNAIVDVVGVVKHCGDVGTVIGKASQKEITKRDLQLVDQSGMVVNLTLWGNDAQQFDGSSCPVVAVKGARLSDYGGRSLSVLASSQLIVNPDIRESHLLRGWYDRDGQSMDFQSFKGDSMAGGGSATNWKHFSQVKNENLGGGDKADYFTSKGTVIFLRKENCMYQACPTESCNKKVIDQGNGMFRCEKCNKEFPNFKYRMILSANLADFSDNQWVTCFQESAEIQVRKILDESRLKTVCVNATPLDFVDYGRRLHQAITC
ncbi:hypothetical protein KUTeg_010129 [Tegillarca granosa]|uniref:Replication protein A subunit n=1 Tax=Tegillarca granosa TaxID=220873 RepID=A0ABQ9F5V8_TEGGR|nr:hypothetical protein KUTeg_010129 [Tegillarca granosa]